MEARSHGEEGAREEDQALAGSSPVDSGQVYSMRARLRRDPHIRPVRLVPALQNSVAKPASERESQPDKRKVVASTAGGAAVAGGGDLISAILRYTTNVVMTHLVTQGIYGIFVETYTLVTVLGYASKLGLDSATLRFLSTYRTKNGRALAAGLLRFASRLALVSGLICAILFFFLSSIIAHAIYHKAIYELPFKEAALLIPLIGMQLVVASGLQALKAIKWKVYVDRLIQPGTTLVLLLIFYALGLRLEALILATTCGFLASTITGQFLLKRAAKKLIKNASPRYERRTWMRFAFPMFFNSMIRNILNSTDILFLGAFAATRAVGLYGAADRVSYFVVAPLIALNVIFSPMIAEYHAHNRQKQLANMFKVVTKWSFSLSWPVFLCCFIFHDAILGVFGEKYMSAGMVLIILALGNLVDSGVGSVNYLIVMTGRPRVILTNTVTTVVANIALAFVLVPRYTIIGAAIAAALTVIILNTVGLIEVYCIMKIHPYRWDIVKPIAAGVVAALVGWGLTRFVHVGYGHLALLGALLLIIPFMITYVLVLALLRFSEEDLMVFDTIRAKFAKKKAA
jgi:O-antigen/teichoic acid export membrane protein